MRANGKIRDWQMNTFKVLQPNDEDDDDEDSIKHIGSVDVDEEVGGVVRCCGAYGCRNPKCQGNRKPAGEKVHFVNAVNQDSGWASLGKGDVVVDSAADESCWPVGQGDAYPTKAASRKMVLRTANGGDTQHYGEKEIAVKYEGGSARIRSG